MAWRRWVLGHLSVQYCNICTGVVVGGGVVGGWGVTVVVGGCGCGVGVGVGVGGVWGGVGGGGGG